MAVERPRQGKDLLSRQDRLVYWAASFTSIDLSPELGGWVFGTHRVGPPPRTTDPEERWTIRNRRLPSSLVISRTRIPSRT